MDLDATRDHTRALLERIHANGNRRDYPRQLIAETRPHIDALNRESDGGEQLPDEEAMKLGIALHVLWLRDYALTTITSGNGRARGVTWTRVATSLHPAFVAPAAFVAAHAFSLSGEVAATGAALEVALSFQPDYTAARLLADLVVAGDRSIPMDDAAEQLDAMQPTADWLRPLTARLQWFRQRDLPTPTQKH